MNQTRTPATDGNDSIPSQLEIVSPNDVPRPKDVFDVIPRGSSLRFRWLRRSWKGPANSIVEQTCHILRDLLSSQEIHAAVLEHLEGMTLAPVIRRLSPGTKIILDAHNVDHLLLQQEAEAGTSTGDVSTKKASKRLKQVENAEKSLAKHVDAFWACSDHDRDILRALNPDLAGYTIANGVDCRSMAYSSRLRGANPVPVILFCGSLGYEANRDGLSWFAGECWPLIKAQLPAARLCVIGAGGNPGDYSRLIQDPDVDFVGEVDSVLPFYAKADISICPLRIGSGTRLKILEALSTGTPVVSTPLGCEGIDITDGVHALLASGAREFAKQCIRLIRDRDLAEYVSHQGRRLVEEKFDWRIIGQMMHESIEEICCTRND